MRQAIQSDIQNIESKRPRRRGREKERYGATEKKVTKQVNKLSIFDKLFTQHFTQEICILCGSDQPARETVKLNTKQQMPQEKPMGKPKA